MCSQLEKKEDELKQAREELHGLNLERLEVNSYYTASSMYVGPAVNMYDKSCIKVTD